MFIAEYFVKERVVIGLSDGELEFYYLYNGTFKFAHLFFGVHVFASTY